MLKTKGRAHTGLTGYRQLETVYPGQTVTDNFRVVRKIDSTEDGEGNCYDWYEIDRHYRTSDRSGQAAEIAGIAFVCMAEAGQINSATAGKHADLFGGWAENAAYQQGAIRSYGGALYRCVQAHTSQAGWEPEAAASLWAKIADPEEEWPEWSAPVGAHDAYAAGSKVSHNGKHWISSLSGNVWEPGVYGWEETAGE